MQALPFSLPLDTASILKKRAQILTALCGMDEGFCSVPVTGIRDETLRAMLRLYDDLFLNGFLSQAFGEIRITLSGRLTSSAGKFIYARSARRRLSSAEIRMSSDFLLRLDAGPFQLNGLSAATPQEAFLIVFEHELCHALETALYGQTGHSQRFLALAHGLFGHTQTRHSLPTRRQEAAKDGLLIGCRVSFPRQGAMLTGVVTYIGKTVTVMVPAPRGEYRDARGRRYCKYHVPPEHLKNNS